VITCYKKVDLFSHELTQVPGGLYMRGAAMRRFGLNTVNRKEAFEWEQVVIFSEAYDVSQHGYRHLRLVVVTMVVVMFGGMCRYNDAPRLLWRNIRFEADGSVFEITFASAKTLSSEKGTSYDLVES